MESTVTLPTWLFVILIVTALWLLLDRVFLPSVRWYLKRRVNRVIEEVNTRLDIEIRPFQLTRKQALVDQLVFDDKVVAAMREHASEHQMPKEVVQAKVVRYANEITPSFNAFIYFRFGYWLAKRVGRMLYRIRVGYYDDNQLAGVDANASVVFVMNHRSNMDYVLVSFLAAERTALSYAVGEWARIWPLQSLIQAMGAFFVRRHSRNPLYRKVLERYVNLATRAGVCQAVFLEGGLSRDGEMREPKQGFLDYMLRDYHAEIDRDVVFIPVGINYDRVIEDQSLVRKLNPEAERRSSWFVIKTSLKFAAKILFMGQRQRRIRFGYAGVNFGQPFSIYQYCQQNQIEFSNLETEERFKQVEILSEKLMAEIAEVIPILPVAVMSEVLIANQAHPLTALQIKTAAIQRVDALEAQGAPIKISINARERVLASALQTFVARGLVSEDEGLFSIAEGSQDIVRYYANSIAHWHK